jgi:hypothetical protein
VVGSLRDQMLYPKPPARVWAGSKAEDKQHFIQVAGEEPQYTHMDAGEAVCCCPAMGCVWWLLQGSTQTRRHPRKQEQKGSVHVLCCSAPPLLC